MNFSLKKGLSVLMATALLLTSGVVSVFAAETTTYTYDMAQGFAYLDCTNANGMTAATVNDGSAMWSFGYTKNGTLTYYPELQRRLWNVAVGKVDAWGGGIQTINDRVVLDPFVSGAIGYGFGTNTEWNTLPLGNTATTHTQPTAVWKAEYKGSVSGALKLMQPATAESSADGVLYRIDKISGTTTTTVYPASGTHTSGDGTSGWDKVPVGETPQTVAFNTTVLAGDCLVLRFDSNQNDAEDRLNLYSYVLTQTVNNADLDGELVIDDLAPVVPTDDTNDLFYSIDDAFAVRNRFTAYTGTDAYLNYRGARETVNGAPTGLYTGLFPAVENNEDSRFELGYYGLGTASGTFTHFTRLSQTTAATAAPEDTNSTATKSLTYGMRVSESTGAGYPVDRTQPASIGTLFGYDNTLIGNSFPGENVRSAVRFTVPRAGVITLSMGLHSPNGSTSDGVLYKITRRYGEGYSKVLTNGYQTAPSDFSGSWSLLEANTSGVVREVVSDLSVSAGDVIELVFDKNGSATDDFFDLVYYTIRYLDFESSDKMVYDMGEGLAVSDVFTGDESATTTEYKNLTPVYKNNDSSESPWRYGYTDRAGIFHSSTVLTRPWFTTTRAPEDTTVNYDTALTYGQASRLQNYSGIYGWDIRNTGYGYVGYDFGNIRTTGSNSFPGYENVGRAAVRFIAPKTGTVVPYLDFYHSVAHTSTKDGVLFKLYKKAVDGTVTTIYPTKGETTYTGSNGTTGWALIPGSGAEAVWENAVIGVKTGDELILQFDPNQYANSDEFTIRKYTLTYLSQQKLEYDLAEAFAVSNTFTGGLEGLYYDYAEGLTPVTPNGAGQWSIGYYNWNTEEFTPFTYLNRGNFTTTRAPEDTNNLWPNSATTLIWATGGTINTYQPDRYVPEAARNEGATGNTEANCSTPAAIGYNFGTEAMASNSFPGHSYTTTQAAIRFSVHHAGHIIPTIKMMDYLANGGVLYRVYKVDGKTGEETAIYPMAGETDYTSADAGTDGWCLLPESMTDFITRDEAVVEVDVGDEIVFRFDKYTTGWPSNKNFIIDTLKINYTEVYEGNPIKSYPEKTEVVYDSAAPQIDLRRDRTSNQVRGTITYTVEDDMGVLVETDTPGVYILTGKVNAFTSTEHTPVKVTASYYALGKPEAPVFTSTTNLYVYAASSRYKAFSAAPFKTSQLGFESDGCLLPYYADDIERALYGTIDLKIHEVWKDATVTFSKDGYFEYLGNGRIRAIAEYDYADAGAAWGYTSGLNATADPYVSPKTTVVAKRDTNTMGTPVVMRLTAPDGGVQEVNLWSFATAIQKGEAEDSYIFNPAVPMSNGITKFESYVGDGTFLPMYPDSARKLHISPVADDMYAQKGSSSYWFPWVPTFETTGDVEFVTVSATEWENYVSNTPFVDHDGVSWTFVAPKTGRVTLTNHLPSTLVSSNNAFYLKNGFFGAVRKYTADGRYTTIYEMTYPASTYNSTEKSVTGTVTAGKTEADGSLLIDVKQGETVRVILYTEYDSVNAGGNSTTLPAGKVPNPVFTYAKETRNEFTATETQATFKQALDETTGLNTNKTYLGIAFGSNGLVVGATTDVRYVAATDTVGAYAEGSISTSEKAAFVKLFFWEDLMNIRPIMDGILIH